MSEPQIIPEPTQAEIDESGIGFGPYGEIGQNYLRDLRDISGLRPEDRVLEVGCGIGRIAHALCGYIDPAVGGHYEGFDIRAKSVAWCADHITPVCPHFHFKHLPVYNGFYAPEGIAQASSIRFPYPDDVFSFVFTVSVFTHMLLPDMAHYLGEIDRVLAPGGRAVSTFLVWNEATALSRPHHYGSFDVVHEGYRTKNGSDREEDLVVHDEAHMLEMWEKQRFGCVRREYGWWRDKRKQVVNYDNFQDFFLFVRA